MYGFRLETTDATLSRDEQEMTRLQAVIAENDAICARLEMEAPRTRERFMIFQEMKAFLRDLLECLNEKVRDLSSMIDCL